MAAAADAATTEEGLPIISGKSEPSTTKPKEEAPPGAACGGCLVLVLWILGVVYLSIGVVYLFGGGNWQRWFGPYDAVQYTVTIAAASGLDPAAKDLHAAAAAGAGLVLVDPAFNLTLGVASPRTAEDRECVQPGTTVEVSYLRSGVPLAAGPAPAFCVEVGERREEGSVIAWGDGVRLPGFVLDSLAADLLRGAAEFGVRITPPIPFCDSGRRFCSDTMDVISCRAKIGGGPAPCSVSKERMSFPPVPRPGVVRDSAPNLPQPTP